MHDHGISDTLIAIVSVLTAILTSDKTLIFLSIVLVIVRLYIALRGEKR